jgi:hypothetical protein
MVIGYLFGLLALDPRGGRIARDSAFVAQGVFIAVVAVCYRFWPDWMWMYLQEPRELNPLLFASVVLLSYILTFLLGFQLPRVLHSCGPRAQIGALGGLILLQILLLVATWDRYSTVVTYSEYPQRRVPLWETGLGTFLNAAFVLGGIGLGTLWWAARRKIRALPWPR